MSRLETYIDPVSTSQLLSSFALAVDETKLVLNIRNLNKQIDQIETYEGRNNRSVYLRKEVIVLEVKLNYIRDRANF